MQWDDADWPEEDDVDVEDADEDATTPCPHCGRDIYEDVEQCPYCGQYILEEDRAADSKPWWIVLGALLCLAALSVWLLVG